MPPFVPGLDLCARFFGEAVAPLLAAHYPTLPYAAARIGPGSDVLGFDTPRSRDHDWGPRVTLFLPPDAPPDLGRAIRAMLARELPREFGGYSTHFDAASDDDAGVKVLSPAPTGGPLRHGVTTDTIPAFLADYLGLDATATPRLADWLTMPAQNLRTIASGRVFHDDLGLEAVRTRLAWYPHDVWLYLLACGWMRISQEAPFMGRCAEAGDELGSRLVAGRLAADAMYLALLMARQYPPYWKWLGTAFGRLPLAAALGPALRSAIAAEDWREREAQLSEAYRLLGEQHNALGLTPPLATGVTPFHDRPYLVPPSDGYAEALLAAVEDPRVRGLPPVGSVSQFADSTDVLSRADRCRALAGIYGLDAAAD